jgi:MerR family transcriptional regulator, copper efflux regulator
MALTRIIKPEMAAARSKGLLNIGEAAAASGVSAKSIRHYEENGLIPKAQRTFANYRLYTPSDVHTLCFIKSARALGFSIADVGKLLQLWQNQHRSSADVKKLALQHVTEMQRMRDTLKRLAHNCHGDARADCPILTDLAGEC